MDPTGRPKRPGPLCWHVDRLDLRILHSMGYTPWGYRPRSADALRPSVIASEHDVSPETVSRRLEGMEADGVITHYEVYPNPDHLGVEIALFGVCLDPGQPSTETLERVQLVDGIVETIEFRGDVLAFGLAYEDTTQRTRRLDLVADLLDVDRIPLLFEPPSPSVKRDLDPLDWRIVDALRGQADASPSDVAESVDASYRTVKRRRDRMIEEGSLFVLPWVQTAAIEGLIHFVLGAIPDGAQPEEILERLQSLFADRIQYVVVPDEADETYAAAATFAKTLADVEKMREQVARLPEVDRAVTFLPKRRTETDWLDHRIARVAEGG